MPCVPAQVSGEQPLGSMSRTACLFVAFADHLILIQWQNESLPAWHMFSEGFWGWHCSPSSSALGAPAHRGHLGSKSRMRPSSLTRMPIDVTHRKATSTSQAVPGRNPKAATQPTHPNRICLAAEARAPLLQQQLQPPHASEEAAASRLHHGGGWPLCRCPPAGGGEHPAPSAVLSIPYSASLGGSSSVGIACFQKYSTKIWETACWGSIPGPDTWVRLQNIVEREGCGVALATCPWWRSRHMMTAYASCCFLSLLLVEYLCAWTLLTSDCRCCATALVISHPSQSQRKMVLFLGSESLQVLHPWHKYFSFTPLFILLWVFADMKGWQ